MLFSLTRQSFLQLFSPSFRPLIWRILGFTLLFMLLVWGAIRKAFFVFLWPLIAQIFPDMPSWMGWMSFAFIITFSIGLAVLLTFFIASFSSFVGGFFIDKAMGNVEKENYPQKPQGVDLSLTRAFQISLYFFVLSLVGNLIALFSLFFPGLHLVIFYGINGYILGRQYFLFAAERFLNKKQAHLSYQNNRFTVFLAGLIITIFLSIPLLNLTTPLFAAIFMAHLYQSLLLKEKTADILTADRRLPAKSL